MLLTRYIYSTDFSLGHGLQREQAEYIFGTGHA